MIWYGTFKFEVDRSGFWWFFWHPQVIESGKPGTMCGYHWTHLMEKCFNLSGNSYNPLMGYLEATMNQPQCEYVLRSMRFYINKGRYSETERDTMGILRGISMISHQIWDLLPTILWNTYCISTCTKKAIIILIYYSEFLVGHGCVYRGFHETKFAGCMTC